MIVGHTKDTTVPVAGKQINLSQVTKEMKKQMTHEKDGRLVLAQQKAGGFGGDDNDGELE